MNLDKGLFRDCAPGDQPDGTWREAKNILADKLRDTLQSEPGFVDIDSQNTNYQLCGSIPIDNDRLVIFQCAKNKTDGSGSQISILDSKGNYTTVLRHNELNFKAVDFFKGVFLRNGSGELIIAWVDTANKPRVLNVDNPQIEINEFGFLSNSEDLDLLDLFIGFHTPKVNVLSDSELGGSLLTGVYYFAFAYETKDGFISNYTHTHGPVSITDDLKALGYLDYDGSEPGIQTNKAIKISLQGVDNRYSYIHLVAISKIDGVLSAKKVKRIPITSEEYTLIYTSDETQEDISLEEVLVGSVSYESANTITLLDDHIHIGDLSEADRINYQKWANSISVEWVYDKFVALDGVSASYKDSVVMYNQKGFMPDETYALYAAFRKKDGTYSEAFHIPGREATTIDYYDSESTASHSIDEDQLLSDLDFSQDAFRFLEEDSLLGSDTKYFHTRDTSHADGRLGYWENLSEKYPDTEDFQVWDATGDTQNDLSGTPVRHHKMPSLSKLHGNNQQDKPWLENSVAALENLSLEAELTISDSFGESDYTLTTSSSGNTDYYTSNTSYTEVSSGLAGWGEVGGENNIYTAAQDQTVEVSFEGQLTVKAKRNGMIGAPPIGSAVYLGLKVIDALGNTVHSYVQDSDFNEGYLINNYTLLWQTHSKIERSNEFTIHLKASESIVVNYTARISNGEGMDPVILAYNGSLALGLNIYTPSELSWGSIEGGTAFAKVLGLKFSNIHIPEHIAPQVDRLEFFYAKRTEKNMSIIGQSLWFRGSTGVKDPDLIGTMAGNGLQSNTTDGSGTTGALKDDSFRFHSFDMLHYKPATKPTHVKLEYFLRCDREAARFYSDHSSAPDDPIFVTNPTSTYAEIGSKKQFATTSNFIQGDAITTPALYGAANTMRLRRVAGVRYMPADTLDETGGYDNRYGEECIVGQILEKNMFNDSGGNVLSTFSDWNAPYDVDTNSGTAADGTRAHLANLCIYRPNMYESFISQDLVSTGMAISIVAPGMAQSDTVYGGDVHLSMYGIRLTAPIKRYNGSTFHYETENPFQTVKMLYYFPCYSVSNIGLRHAGIGSEQMYYPKNGGSIDSLAIDYDVLDPYLLRSADSAHSNYIGYNDDYSSVNDLNKVFPYNTYTTFEKHHPYRIARGVIQRTENNVISMRKFLANDYYEMPKAHGKIVDLRAYNGELLIQMESSLYKTIGKETFSGETLDVTLGTGDIFRLPPKQLITDQMGYLGCQDRSGTSVTKLGYLCLDREQGKVFLVSDSINELSSKGLRNWFQQNLGFALDGFLSEQDQASAKQDSSCSVAGIGYTLYYDELNNRLLLTKKDFIPKQDTQVHYNPQDLSALEQGDLVFTDGLFYMVEDDTPTDSPDSPEFSVPGDVLTYAQSVVGTAPTDDTSSFPQGNEDSSDPIY